MKRDYMDLLDDLIEAVEKAIAFTANIDYEEFRADDRTNYAVVRALEIVGEPVKQLPEEMRSRYQEVPWSAMADPLHHGSELTCPRIQSAEKIWSSRLGRIFVPSEC